MAGSNKQRTLGESLKAARMAAGLSVRELARLTEITHGYLVKLEHDQKEHPSADKLMRLADVLEVDPAELLGFIGVEPSAILPPARVYCRKKYGLGEEEAAEVEKLVDRFRKERNVKGGGDYDEERKQ